MDTVGGRYSADHTHGRQQNGGFPGGGTACDWTWGLLPGAGTCVDQNVRAVSKGVRVCEDGSGRTGSRGPSRHVFQLCTNSSLPVGAGPSVGHSHPCAWPSKPGNTHMLVFVHSVVTSQPLRGREVGAQGGGKTVQNGPSGPISVPVQRSVIYCINGAPDGPHSKPSEWSGAEARGDHQSPSPHWSSRSSASVYQGVDGPMGPRFHT